MDRLLRKGITFSIIIFVFNFCFGQTGTVPVILPPGGFKIDGYLQRQGAAGDWLSGPGGNEPGTYLLNNNGVPVLPSPIIYHSIDKWNNSQDNIFQKGKFNDHPNSMKWILGKPQSKFDINNGLVYLNHDLQFNFWAILAGDRFNTNGNMYIDFEFLRSPVVKIGGGEAGGFYSFGWADGREWGDVLVSVELRNGSPTTNVKVYIWSPICQNGNGTFCYVDNNFHQI